MKSTRTQIKQILDANLNRVLEGIRVLEEIARFIYNDKHLTFSFKKLRHEITRELKTLQLKPNLLLSRDTDSDPIKYLNSREETLRPGLYSIILSNSGRVKEALRVLEEFLKLLNTKSSRKIKSIRFRFYDLEKELTEKFSAKKEILSTPQLYPILDINFCNNIKTTKKILNKTKIKLLQLRAKNIPDKKFYKTAIKLKRNLNHDTLFIINDRVDIALSVDADGVHLGQDDLDVKVVRNLIGERSIIGVSAENFTQLEKAVKDGADYIGFGPIYPTETKLDASDVKSLRKLKEISKRSPIPIAPIGGVKPEHTTNLLKNGGTLISVISSIFGSVNPENSIKKFNKGLMNFIKMKGGK